MNTTAPTPGFDCSDWTTYAYPAYIGFSTPQALKTSEDGTLLYIGGSGVLATFDGSSFALHTDDIKDDTDTADRNINAIAFYKGEIVIGGQFGVIDGTTAKGVGRYHDDGGGFAWEQMGQGLGSSDIIDRVTDLLVADGKLFACGAFEDDGDSEKLVHLAVYNDGADKWEGIGSQTDIDTSGLTKLYSLGTYSKKLTGGQ